MSGSVVLNVLATNGYTAAVLGDNPIAYWRLDETSGTIAHDYVGGNNGTYVNTVLNQHGYAYPADTDACVEFTSTQNSGSYVQTTTSAPFDWANTPSFTLEAWVNLTNANFPATMFGTWVNTGDMGYGFSIQSANQLDFAAFGIKDYYSATYTAGFSLNTWYHLVCVSDGSSLYFYVNGQPISSTPWVTGSGISGTVGDLILGRECGGNPAYNGGTLSESQAQQFKGFFDDAAVYSHALTAAEISTIATPPQQFPPWPDTRTDCSLSEHQLCEPNDVAGRKRSRNASDDLPMVRERLSGIGCDQQHPDSHADNPGCHFLLRAGRR